MDDEDDKIRRNLVVVSATILIAAFLEVPQSALLSTLVGKEGSSIPQWKFWAVGCALLAYLGARYRFSHEGQKMVRALVVSNEQSMSEMRDAFLTKILQRHIDTGVIHPGLEMFAAFVESARKMRGDGAAVRVMPEFTDLKIPSAKAKGTLRFLSRGGDEIGQVPFVNIPVSTSRFKLYWLVVRANWNGLIYSEAGVRNLFPILFGISAASLLAWRGVYAWYLYLSS
ncbi:MAG: hypothetical protein V4757_06690 [Pseudomonadota bacterium]